MYLWRQPRYHRGSESLSLQLLGSRKWHIRKSHRISENRGAKFETPPPPHPDKHPSRGGGYIKERGRIKFLPQGASTYNPPPPFPEKCLLANKMGGGGGGVWKNFPWPKSPGAGVPAKNKSKKMPFPVSFCATKRRQEIPKTPGRGSLFVRRGVPGTPGCCAQKSS